MKKISICIIAVLLATALLLTACDAGSANQSQDAPYSIVATTFPQYDWLRAILGDNPGNVKLTLLLDNGVDLHNYQPTTDDIITISSCDLFVYVGGTSDAWVDDALKNAANKDMTVINLMEVLGDAAKEEALVEGMEHEHDEDHEEDHDEDHPDEHDEEDEGAHELDEHVWLSLRNAQLFCTHIAEALGSMDAANKSVYEDNVRAYNESLAALDFEYETAVDGATRDTLLFADRFPFRYLVDDYGIQYFAAFSGCSAETEASFETVAFLAQKVDELQLAHVLVIDTSDQSIARTVIDNTAGKDQDILVLNSMQSVTAAQIDAGTSYLSIAQANLDALRAALD